MESPKYCGRFTAHFEQKSSKCSAVSFTFPQWGQIGDKSVLIRVGLIVCLSVLSVCLSVRSLPLNQLAAARSSSLTSVVASTTTGSPASTAAAAAAGTGVSLLGPLPDDTGPPLVPTITHLFVPLETIQPGNQHRGLHIPW